MPAELCWAAARPWDAQCCLGGHGEPAALCLEAPCLFEWQNRGGVGSQGCVRVAVRVSDVLHPTALLQRKVEEVTKVCESRRKEQERSFRITFD